LPVSEDERSRADPSKPEPGPAKPKPTPILWPLIGAAVLIGVLYYTMDRFHRWDVLQACVTAGRRNCDR
jgi:hypothetical protein